ncbi:hypothetical protein I3760_15G113900 [Carya illinoinensis]|nr:hypothetical protein I3760_15G113900 [Carya illinoinensis]
MVNHTSLHVAKYPVGIESRVKDVYQHLSIGRNDITCIVGIVGVGGIGKTTISKKIYNMISYQFEGSCFLKDVRETSKQRSGLIQLQNRLLYEILRESLDVRDSDIGVNVIRHRLCSKRVLLILDDVDEFVQLENLAGDHNWFGLGSRIIITTRDRHLLNNPKANSVHEVKILDYNEALRLFSWHAFEKEEPIENYVKLSKQVLQYAQGLPLVLTILGSDLKGRSLRQWKSALGKYRKTPNGNIQKVLQISYNGLDDNEKDMFLDIAFFFKGELLANVIKIFDNCGFSPDDGINRLLEKCLITVDNDTLRMHDVLQDMGREIVRLQSPKELGKRSRLWFHEEVRHVLEESTGTNKVEGIVIDLPDGEDIINLGSDAFVSMKGLRVFINRNARFSEGPNYLSNELRVLDWLEYPMQSLPPNFNGKKLIIFRMRESFIMELGQRFKGHYHEVSSDSGRFTRPDDVQLSGTKAWVVDIEGPHYLENISGIALYCVVLFKHDDWFWDQIRAEITCDISNHVCYIEREVQLLKLDFHSTAYKVWVAYSSIQSFKLKVLDNLRVHFYFKNDHRGKFYNSCGANVVYKHKRRAKEEKETRMQPILSEDGKF